MLEKFIRLNFLVALHFWKITKILDLYKIRSILYFSIFKKFAFKKLSFKNYAKYFFIFLFDEIIDLSTN